MSSDQVLGSDQGPGSTADALGMLDRALDFLNGPGRDTDPAALGDVLRGLAGIGAKYAAARMHFLAAFDAGDCHDADGFPASGAST